MSRPRWKLRGLDSGIREAVWALARGGVQTFESCEGGPGHAFPEPTVCFEGTPGEGFRALEIVLRRPVRDRIGAPLNALRREWLMVDGELTGPWWTLTWRTSGKGVPVSPREDGEARSSCPPCTHCPCGRPSACSETSGGKADRLLAMR